MYSLRTSRERSNGSHLPFVLSVVFAMLLVHGCAATYAPPVRVNHYGAPAEPKAGQMELLAAAQAVVIPYGGHGSFNYAFTDKLQLELGVDGFAERFMMGHVGVRYVPLNGRFKSKINFTLDLEAGVGVGAGGDKDCVHDDEDCTAARTDELRWNERLAGGGHVGTGFGMNISWFDLFARARIQLTGATNVPPTLWYSTVGGLQATIKERAKLYVAGGGGRVLQQSRRRWRICPDL